MNELPKLPGFNIISSKDTLGQNTKLAMLLWSPSGYGKTNLAGTLDALTQKYEKKRTLYIPVEQAEGGGAVTIRKLDIPMYLPKSYSDIDKILGYLKNDKSFGGIVLDSATETAKQHVQPEALKYPCRENVATRAAGVPTRSDYQVMGELLSQLFRKVLSMSAHPDPACRKHVIITATDKKDIDQETDKILWHGPELPGRMAKEAVSMFQVSSTIIVKAEVVDGKRVSRRYLQSSADGVKALKDRFEVMPAEILLRKDPSHDGEDLETIWTKYWVPAMA